MDNTNVLTSGPISRGLIQLAFPILCSNILQCLNGTLSAFWVGRYLGEAALAAVANAQSMMFLLTGVAFGITMASTILVGRCMAVGNVAGAKRVLSTGAMFFVVLSIVVTILGLLFARPLLMAMRAAPETLPLAVPYMRVTLLALPGAYVLAFAMSLLIGIGDSKTPLKFVALLVALGTILTPLFMFAANALLGAGVIGAAIATFAAQNVCLVVLLRYLYRRGHPLCLTRQEIADFRVDWTIVGELVRKGVPMGAQVLVISLSSVLMIGLVNRFGVQTTAAYGALMQLWTYIIMPALAIAVAVSTMAAQSIGAQNWERVTQTARIGVWYSFVLTGVVVGVVYLAGAYAFRLFLPEGSAALAIASHINHLVTWSILFMSIPVVLFGVMRAAGAVMVPLLVHVVSLLMVRYPLAAILIGHWQADAIWWSFTISSGVDVGLAVVYYWCGGWRMVAGVQVSADAHDPIGRVDRLRTEGIRDRNSI